MANFQAHFTSATITSSLAASSVLSLQLVNQNEIIVLWLLGLLGGMLPDIDSDDSKALRIVFKLLGITVALSVALWLQQVLSMIGLWLVGTLVFALIRYALVPLFEMVTVHRGSIHSLLSCFMFGLVAVQLSVLCGASVVFAWCAGLFIILGMLTHLTLDEMYSVNLSDMEFKRSFGSALKVLSIDYPLATAAQVLICIPLIYFAPSPEPFLSAVQTAEFDFLPLGDWAALREFFNLEST
jgi:hypothetical protein